MPPAKAAEPDYMGRFREIIADPLNLLIERVPMAGVVDGRDVCLHNGNKVPLAGDGAYYGPFSQILIVNRGVHEPLEEYVFQETLKKLPEVPVMIELGAYWAHYSMWLKKLRPHAQKQFSSNRARGNFAAGRGNFAAMASKASSSARPWARDSSKSTGFWRRATWPVFDIPACGYSQDSRSRCWRLHARRSRAQRSITSSYRRTPRKLSTATSSTRSCRADTASRSRATSTMTRRRLTASSLHQVPAADGSFGSSSPFGRTKIAEASPDRMIEAVLAAKNSVA